MTLEQFIFVLEEDYIQEDLDSLSPKDRITIWLSAKEFQRAKLMRGNAVPIDENEEDRNIYVSIKRDVETDKEPPKASD